MRLKSTLVHLCIFGVGQLCHPQVISIPQATTVVGEIPTQADATRSAQRFLGWRYARLAQQDTSQWTRKHSLPEGKGDDTSTRPTNRLVSTQIGPSVSVSNAGFATATKLPTGFLPTGAVQGDFNGDGRMDIAISNGGDDSVYVYLGKGDGTFEVPEILYTTGHSPVWLVAAQLRSGGHLDLITVDGDSNQVEIFSGKGDGTFKPASVLATLSQTPSFLLTGDFNKDGHTDLVVGLVVDALSIEPQFELLLGDGTGVFPSTVTPPPVDNSQGGSPLPTSWMAMGDLNNDGFTDLVTTVAFAGAIAYMNQAGKSFKQGTLFNPDDTAVAVGLGDMDGDGCVDALETGVYGYLTIAKGNCDGTFTQSGPTAELGDVEVAVTAADVNGDGKLDVVASSAFSDAEVYGGGPIGAYGGYLVSVLLGDGAGHLSPAALCRVGSEAYSFALSDLRGTGQPDIVTISQTEETASLLTNDGRGSFGFPSGETIGYLTGVTNAPIPSGKPQTFDLNGDGKPDVILIEFGENATMPSLVTALLNDGTGKLGPPIRSPITVGSNTPYPLFVAGKFRNAEPADIVYIDQYSSGVAAFIPGNGDGTFAAPVSLAKLPVPYQIVSGDFNGDGKLDFAVFGYASANSIATTELDVFLGNGDGTFKQLPAQTFAALAPANALPTQLIAGDFNHDGKLDLLIDNSGVDLDLALGNGDGTFRTPSTIESNFGPVSVTDFNHDGYLDLVQPEDPDANITEQALTAAGGPFSVPAATVYLGGPGGTFTKQTTFTAAGVLGSGELLVGDFNGDGNADIVLSYLPATIGRPWERRLQILQGNGDGTFDASGIPYQLPAYDLPVVGGDYRGLGVTDLLDLVGATSSINTLSASPSPALALVADSTPLTGIQGSATVVLAVPAASIQTVQLSSSDPAVTLPGSLSFNSGDQQQSFTFTIGSSFDSSKVLAITAILGGQSATAYFAKANPNLRPTVTAIIGGILPGSSSTATSPGGNVPLLLTLESVSGYSGTFGKFACSGLPAGAQCTFAEPTVLLLPGGFAQVAFDLTTTSLMPTGTYQLSISASNGELTPAVPLTLGVGGFSIAANPSTIELNGPNSPTTTVTAAYTNGYSETIQLSCRGLPNGASCNAPGAIYPSNLSTPVSFSGSPGMTAQDYSFSIIGTDGNVTATTNAILRVSSFSAVLATDTATIAKGGSANFNVTLQSLNHFSNNSISLNCQSSAAVTCTTPNSTASLTDGGSTTVPLTVTASTSASAPVLRTPWIWPWQPSFAIILLVFNVKGPTRRRRLRKYWHIVVLALTMWTISACSGSGGGTGPNSHTVTVSVSAQAQTGSGVLQESAGTITLTIPN